MSKNSPGSNSPTPDFPKKGLYKLFIDDERFPPGDWLLSEPSWAIARKSAEAIRIVQDYGIPSFISYDHDLGGSDTVMNFIDWYLNYLMDFKDAAENSDIALDTRRKWYADIVKCISNYQIHSQNVAAVPNIKSKLDSFCRAWTPFGKELTINIGSIVVFENLVFKYPYSPYYDRFKGHVFKVKNIKYHNQVELKCVSDPSLEMNHFAHLDELKHHIENI